MRRSFISLHFIVCVFSVIAVWETPAVAQRTVTNDAGSGRKIVLHYNAADQITETDTLGPNGELLEKDTLQYRPNAYSANTLRTSYWPNGKPHKITENTYDDNSNYLTEYIQVFDESGKQIGGHKLTHDPMTNVFTAPSGTCGAELRCARMSRGRGVRGRAREREEIHRAGSDAAIGARAPDVEGGVSQWPRCRDQEARPTSKRLASFCRRTFVRANAYQAAWLKIPPTTRTCRSSS